MNALQLEHLWVRAGGPPALKVKMAAIGLAESGGGKQIHGDWYPFQGFTSFGIWQVHTRDWLGRPVNTMRHGRPYSEHRLAVDPIYNAKAAYAVFRSQGLNAWSTHLHHEDRAFLPAARWAVGHDMRLAMREYRSHHHRRRVVAHRHHQKHHPAPEAALGALSHLAASFTIALAFFGLMRIARHACRLLARGIAEDIAIRRRALRMRARQEEAALRKRTMPRAPRRTALA